MASRNGGNNDPNGQGTLEEGPTSQNGTTETQDNDPITENAGQAAGKNGGDSNPNADAPQNDQESPTPGKQDAGAVATPINLATPDNPAATTTTSKDPESTPTTVAEATTTAPQQLTPTPPSPSSDPTPTPTPTPTPPKTTTTSSSSSPTVETSTPVTPSTEPTPTLPTTTPTTIPTLTSSSSLLETLSSTLQLPTTSLILNNTTATAPEAAGSTLMTTLYTTFLTTPPPSSTSSATANLQSSISSVQRSTDGLRTTVIAIAAPIAGVTVIGGALLFLYRKKLLCFGRLRGRSGGGIGSGASSLLEQDGVVGEMGSSWRPVYEYADKFDPARNY